MINTFNFEPYLQSLRNTYEQWWNVHSFTSVAEDLFDNWERQRFLYRLQHDHFRDKRRKLLIGQPGTGKSTLLNRLLLDAAKNAQLEIQSSRDSYFLPEEFGKRQPLIPMLIQLQNYEHSVLELIQKFIQKYDVNLQLEEATLHYLLRQGYFLVLLDGIDELPSLAAQQDLIAFCRQYPATKIIATRGDNRLGGDLGISESIGMPLLERSQMRKLVKLSHPEIASALIEQIDSCWQKIAPTPLLLQILCQTFSTTLQVPANSSLLLRQFSQLPQHPTELALLHSLAFAMMQGTSPQFSGFSISRQVAELILSEKLDGQIADPNSVVKISIDSYLSSGLLQLGTDEKLTFPHALFQKYYAAEFLLSQLSSLSDEQLQWNYLNAVKWTETITLLMPLIEDEFQALRIVQLALNIDWQLAAKLSGAVKPEWQAQTVSPIASISVPNQFKIFLLGLTRSPEVIPELLQLKIQSKPEHWNSDRILEALGKIGTPEAIVPLCQTFENVRSYSEPLQAAEALARIGTSAEIVALVRGLHNTHEEVRIAVLRALAEIGSPEAIPAIAAALKDPDSSVRIEAAKALAAIGSAAALHHLCQALLDESGEYVRREIARSLATLKNPDTVPVLAKTAKEDPDFTVRLDAVTALGAIDAEAAIYNLCQLLIPEPHLSVKEAIAISLANSGSQAAISALRQALHAPDFAGRSCIVAALRQVNHPAVISLLCEAVHHDDRFVRQGAVAALATSDFGITALLETLSNESLSLDFSTIELLEKLATDRVIPVLRDAIAIPEDEFYLCLNIGRRAARALRHIGTPLAIAALQAVLVDENRLVRWNAAIALGSGESQSKVVIPELENRDLIVAVLCEILIEGNDNDRFAAACALAHTCNETAIPALQTALFDHYGPVADWSAIALRHLGTEAAISALKTAMSDFNSAPGTSVYREFWLTGTKEAITSACLALQSPDARMRALAARVLKEVGDTTVVSSLCHAVNDPDEEVCENAIVALGKIGDVRAIPTLAQTFAIPNNKTRFLVVEALEKIGTEAAISILYQGLTVPDINAFDETELRNLDIHVFDIRERIVKALCNLGSEEVVEVWRSLLLEPNNRLCLLAIQSLEKVGTVAAIEALSVIFRQEERDDLRVSERAIEALENIGSGAAVLALCDIVIQQHPLSLLAINVLGYWGNAAAIPTLLTALQWPNFDSRYRTAVALGKIGATEALPILLQILEESVSFSCYEVADAIGKIASLELVPQLYTMLLQSDAFSLIDLPSAISLIQGRYGFYKQEK